MTPEFSRRYALDTIGGAGQRVAIEAFEGERAALAARFDLIALDVLTATATLVIVVGGAEARGAVRARAVQACVVTGDRVTSDVDEPFALRFIDAPVTGDEEVELTDAECDLLPFDGGHIDLGEAVAQTLGLALDPFPRSATADEDRVWSAGPQGGAFAGLAALLPKDETRA